MIINDRCSCVKSDNRFGLAAALSARGCAYPRGMRHRYPIATRERFLTGPRKYARGRSGLCAIADHEVVVVVLRNLPPFVFQIAEGFDVVPDLLEVRIGGGN